LMYYDAGITMKMRASAPSPKHEVPGFQGFIDKLMGFGKAVLSGHTLFMMYFTNTTQRDLIIAFSMPYGGMVLPIDLASVGNKIICQNDCFLCSSVDLKMSPATPRDLGGNFITSAFAMQKIEGNGTLFLFCGGSLVQKNITQASNVHVTKGSTLALQPGIILKSKTITNVGLTGQGHEITEISGTGRVWIQSLPYKRTKDSLIEQVGMFFGLSQKKENPVWGKFGKK
jgi:uncharacterized protein (AIM24 family)